ncbi:MAG: PIN domain-containing protein [Desulfoferrobacter sp.]
MRSFFDTNVLVYLFDEDASAKKARAQLLLQEEVEAGRATLSTQVLQEFYVVVTRKLAKPLPLDLAEQAVRNLAALNTIQVDTALVLAAIARNRQQGFSFWDSLIIETALASGAKHLFSEDLQNGQIIQEMQIQNPFLALPVEETDDNPTDPKTLQ